MEPRPPWDAVRPRRAAVAMATMLLALAATELLARSLFSLEPLQTYRRALIVLPIILGFGLALWAGQRGGGLVGVAGALFTAWFLLDHGTTPDVRDRIAFGSTLGLVVLLTCFSMGRHRDSTERLREEAVRAEQARAAAAEMRNRELAQTNIVLRDFTHVVAHDLRNPVRGIQMLLRDIEERTSPKLAPEEREDVALLRREADRLHVLLEELLDYSRVTRVAALTLRAVRVGDVLRSESCRARYEALLRERSGTLEVVGEERSVLANPGALEIILGNLVVNALRHAKPERPRVRLEAKASARPGLVEIRIEDDGVGFAPGAVAAHERVLAGEESGDPTGRGGFGLLLVTRAAQRVGGTVELGRSSLGGAAVHVFLPAGEVTPAAAGDAASPRTGGPGTP